MGKIQQGKQVTAPLNAGWLAHKAGLPIDANPHKPGPFSPDNYPGLHAVWRDGWMTRANTIRHDAERVLQKQTGGVK